MNVAETQQEGENAVEKRDGKEEMRDNAYKRNKQNKMSGAQQNIYHNTARRPF